MLSEATGGLQGSEAIQAFTMRMMNMTDRFSRTGAGRYMTFAMSNENGTGLDQVALARMRAGDISVSEIRRRAQHNVNSMGRARALNQEGFLRGAQMEEGGVSGQLTHIRQAMGEAGVDPGSERAQHWMRRVHHLSQSEAQLMSTLMRNQGSIALNEDVTRAASGREAAYNREVSEHRSFDAFTRQLEHGLSENLGMTEARDMGRRFATRISSAVERGFNAMMGLAEGQLSRDQQMSLARISLGRGTAADIREAQRGFSGGPGFSGTWNPNSSSLADQLLHGMGMHSRGSVTEQMEARGDRNFGRYGAVTQIDRVMRADLARQGVVTGADRTALEGLMGARQDTLADITQAQMRAHGAGHEDNWYQYLRGAGNGNANAVDAYLASINATGAQGRAPSVEQGMMGRGGVGAAVDAMFGSTRYDNAMSFVAGGGHAMRRERASIDAERRRFREGPFSISGMMEMQARSDRGSAAAAGLVGDEEALRGLMGGGTFRTLYDQALGSTGNAGAFQSGLSSLREEALRMEGPQRATAQSLIRQMEESYKVNGGRLGTEFSDITQDPRQRDAYRRQIAVTQGNFRVMGAQIGGLQGLESFGSQLTGIADLYARGGPDAANQINQGMFDFTRNVAHASDADRQRLYEQMGTTDHGRMMMQSIMQYEARDMNLGGRGRRGAMGARESAAELATGGSVGDMEFRVRGRRVRGRQGLEAAARLTGDDLTAARSDYIRQMQEQGVGAEGAGQMFDAYRRASSGSDTENGRRVQFNQSERDELQKLAQSTGIDEART
jgi:hypothetical protein